jgi:hypothetical protein
MNVRPAALALLGSALLDVSACTSPQTPSTSRLGRHFDRDPWSTAVVRNVEQPEEWVPELLFLAAAPLLHQQDHGYRNGLQSNHVITGSSTASGNVTLGALAAASAAVSGWKWYEGDHAQSLEVATESFALTALGTFVTQDIVRRHRPGDGQPTSFPSGHASFSFAASTFLARTIWDESGSDNSWTTTALGAACYLPAAWVALNRVDSGRHFPSDVAFGALLGTLTTNLVWDAHYGDPERRRGGIFGLEMPSRLTLSPVLLPDGAGLLLTVRF